MNRIGWMLFTLTVVLLTIKLYIILTDHIDMVLMLHEVHELRSRIAAYFNDYWLFVEPVLISISLVGFLLRKQLGFQLALTFVYFVIAYGLLHYLTPVNRLEHFHFGIMNGAILVAILTNIPATVRIFSPQLTIKHQIQANLLALLIGFTLNAVMLTITT